MLRVYKENTSLGLKKTAVAKLLLICIAVNVSFRLPL